MADQYGGGFADISAFVADTNAINSATKTALNTALLNIYTLFNPASGVAPAHPDFGRMNGAAAARIKNEIDVLRTAITAHA